MRAFVGLPVPEAWITPLVRAQRAIPGGRAVPPEDLHVTLAFLDDQPEDRLADLHAALDARRPRSAMLTPAAFAAFGSDRARLAALDLVSTPDLTALRDGVRSAARAVGIDLPRDRFRPHVTMVRFAAGAPADPGRLAQALAALGPPDLAPQPSPLCVLWASTLTPGGPIYDPIGTYPLAAA